MTHQVTIYQIRDIENVDYAFQSFNSKLFNLDDYKKVYELKVDDTDRSNIDILEDIFMEFNVNIPKDFSGHSLSVSDVVYIDNDGFYCGPISWIQI